MKLRNAGRYILIAAAGLIVFVTGLVLAAISRDADGIMKTLPFILVGVGSGIFGGNIGTALKKKEMFKHPEAAKQMEIERRDERNQAISAKAKARVFDLMIYIFAAIILAFSLMQVDLPATLTLVATYLFFIFAYVHYLNKFNREM